MSAICGNCVFYRNKNEEFCTLGNIKCAYDYKCNNYLCDMDAVCICETCQIQNKFIDGCRTGVKDWQVVKGIGVVPM